MSEHYDNLEKARAKLIEMRRAFARALADTDSKRERYMDNFLLYQNTIEAIDKAMADEQMPAIKKFVR